MSPVAKRFIGSSALTWDSSVEQLEDDCDLKRRKVASVSDFGVIGLGVMGQNLALNIEEHGFSVAVWNLETDWTERFVQQNAGKKITGAKSLDEFVKGLRTPRRILMMIKAGEPVDSMIAQLSPLLRSGRHSDRWRKLLV